MFRQYARTARSLADTCKDDAWVHAGTHVLCTPEELKQHLDRPARFSCLVHSKTLEELLIHVLDIGWGLWKRPQSCLLTWSMFIRTKLRHRLLWLYSTARLEHRLFQYFMIFYGRSSSLSSSQMAYPFLSYLTSVAANASTIRYAVRHYTPQESPKPLMNLQGKARTDGSTSRELTPPFRLWCRTGDQVYRVQGHR